MKTNWYLGREEALHLVKIEGTQRARYRYIDELLARPQITGDLAFELREWVFQNPISSPPKASTMKQYAEAFGTDGTHIGPTLIKPWDWRNDFCSGEAEKPTLSVGVEGDKGKLGLANNLHTGIRDAKQEPCQKRILTENKDK